MQWHDLLKCLCNYFVGVFGGANLSVLFILIHIVGSLSVYLLEESTFGLSFPFEYQFSLLSVLIYIITLFFAFFVYNLLISLVYWFSLFLMHLNLEISLWILRKLIPTHFETSYFNFYSNYYLVCFCYFLNSQVT